MLSDVIPYSVIARNNVRVTWQTKKTNMNSAKNAEFMF